MNLKYSNSLKPEYYVSCKKENYLSFDIYKTFKTIGSGRNLVLVRVINAQIFIQVGTRNLEINETIESTTDETMR